MLGCYNGCMHTKKVQNSSFTLYRRVFLALILSNSVTLLLYVFRSVESQTNRYWFLVWNLFLAWLPLFFAYWLKERLRTTGWISWQNILLSLLWLSFLPNSFYLASDLIHLHETGEVSLLYDIVMFCSFIFNAYIAGFMSLFIIHTQLLKRMRYWKAYGCVSGVLLACGFAIYLGRSLRWNSWDILLSPAGVLFDVSEQVINPVAHPQSFVTTATFFVLIFSTYSVIWELSRALQGKR